MREQVLEELAADLEDNLADTLRSARASQAADTSSEAARRPDGGSTQNDGSTTALALQAPEAVASGPRAADDGPKTGRRKGRQGFGISVGSSLDVVLGLVGALVVQQAEMDDSVARTALDTMNV